MSSRVLTAVAWPYANGPRHIGHVAGFGVPSDVFSRYSRMAGRDVLMVSGTDEHGTPIQVQADREGVTARGYFQIRCKYGEGSRLIGEPAGWAQHEADERAYVQAEETRLLYVAATRARETLVVGRWDKPGSSSNSAWRPKRRTPARHGKSAWNN